MNSLLLSKNDLGASRDEVVECLFASSGVLRHSISKQGKSLTSTMRTFSVDAECLKDLIT
jgi:hypothetical protein